MLELLCTATTPKVAAWEPGYPQIDLTRIVCESVQVNGARSYKPRCAKHRLLPASGKASGNGSDRIFESTKICAEE